MLISDHCQDHIDNPLITSTPRARSGGSSHEKRVKLWSESPEKHVILLCFQSEALTLTSKVSQPLLQDGREKWWVNQIQSQSTRKYSRCAGNSVLYLMGININCLDAVSWSVYPLHYYEGINMHLCMLPVTPSRQLPCIWQWLYTSMDTQINWLARQVDPTQNYLHRKKKSHTNCTVASSGQRIQRDYRGWEWGEKEERTVSSSPKWA